MTEETGKPVTACCVIPAAGRSSRMPAWKPLLPWGASTVCGAVVDAALAAGLLPVVVAGYRGDELAAAFSDRPEVAVVVNDDWERGMLGSIRTGAEAARRLGLASGAGGPEGFFVVPADMPRVPARAFGLVAAGAGAGTCPRSVFASRRERLGHPVWIPFAFVAGMAALDPDARLRTYLLSLPWSRVEVDDDGIFDDLDTPEEYEGARASILTE
jgi:molybdenum cofactor cytidylyltransferase